MESDATTVIISKSFDYVIMNMWEGIDETHVFIALSSGKYPNSNSPIISWNLIADTTSFRVSYQGNILDGYFMSGSNTLLFVALDSVFDEYGNNQFYAFFGYPKFYTSGILSSFF